MVYGLVNNERMYANNGCMGQVWVFNILNNGVANSM